MQSNDSNLSTFQDKKILCFLFVLFTTEEMKMPKYNLNLVKTFQKFKVTHILSELPTVHEKIRFMAFLGFELLDKVHLKITFKMTLRCVEEMCHVLTDYWTVSFLHETTRK